MEQSSRSSLFTVGKIIERIAFVVGDIGRIIL